MQGDTVPERWKVETRTWLQILSVHSLVFSRLNRAFMQEFGISVAKFEFLAQVDRYPEGVSLGQISDNLRVTSGNVSGLVRRLLADGLITKKMSQEDRRSFIVRFSPKGRDLFDRAALFSREQLSEVFAGVPLAELEQVQAFMKALSARLQEQIHDAGSTESE